MSRIRLFVLAASVLPAQAQEYRPDLPAEHPAIRYAERAVADPVARLSRDDVASLTDLASLLRLLDVPADSQMLAFAKTSFQAERIAPDNPRAIYFNDDIAVAFVRGSELVEIAAVDPTIGPVFYSATLPTIGTEGFVRRQVCLECHLGPATLGVSGLFVGSVFPGPTGKPARADAIITDHRTPFEHRWGGWYVNAQKGQQRDRSNAVASNPAQPFVLDSGASQNRPHLYDKFDPAGYLAPVSDIVALMTFEHQTQMLNHITRVSWQERIAAHDGHWTPSERSELDADIRALVAYMLFDDEVELPVPLTGVSTFARTFEARGPTDSQGRSLRDFDLERRLFRHRLSYMIYSPSFDALSEDLEQRIYRRLYDRLTSDERAAALQILRETKPGLPPYYMEESETVK